MMQMQRRQSGKQRNELKEMKEDEDGRGQDRKNGRKK